MSAELLADVWRELLDRRDCDNLARECFGQFNIYAAADGLTGGPNARQSCIQLLIRLRIFFDLQRTYLQSRPNQSWNAGIQAYLVAPSLHHAIILRIIQLGTTLIHRPTLDEAQTKFQRRFLLQTLLSAIRAFLLRNASLNWNEIQALRSEVENLGQKWSPQAGILPCNVEFFVLRDLLPTTLNAIKDSTQSPRLKLLACGVFDLPDYASGLYPFEIHCSADRDQPYGTVLSDTIQRLDQVDWLEAYWTLCDVIWSVKAATIKCYVEKASREDFDTTHAEMRQILSMIFDRNDLPAQWSRRSPSLESLCDTMLTCFAFTNAPRGILSVMQDDPVHPSVDQPLGSMQPMLDLELRTFATFLKKRKKQLRDCNGDVEREYDSLSERVQGWYHAATGDVAVTGLEVQSSRLSRSCVPLYFVNCPQLHPISKVTLEGLLQGEDQRRFEQHQDSAEPFEIQELAHCPYCPVQNIIHMARPVPPLSHVESAFRSLTVSPASYLEQLEFIELTPSAPEILETRGQEELVGVSNEIQARSETISPRSDAPVLAPSDPSPVHWPTYSEALQGIRGPVVPGMGAGLSRDSSLSTDSSTTRRRSQWNIRFGSISQSRPLLPNNIAFCFSPAGQSLFLWHKGSCDTIAKVDTPFQDGTTYSLLASGHESTVSGVDVKHVAAGHRNVSVFVQVGPEDQKLYIFDEHGARYEAQNNAVLGSRGTCFSLAMAPNGSLVALTWGSIVQIYKFVGGSIDLLGTVSIHESVTGGAVKYQAVNFSLDSRYLVVATQEDHGMQHIVYIRVWRCSASGIQIRWRLKPFKLGLGYADDTGLNSVFLDKEGERSFLTANHRKPYPVISSLRNNGLQSPPNGFPKNIVAVAQAPSGQHFALKNGQNCKLSTFDFRTGVVETLVDFESERRNIRKEPVALAMPEENLVYALWRKEAKLVFKKITMGPRAHVEEVDLRAVYDKCFPQS